MMNCYHVTGEKLLDHMKHKLEVLSESNQVGELGDCAKMCDTIQSCFRLEHKVLKDDKSKLAVDIV